MTKATLTTTRSGRPRAHVDPAAVAAEVESLKSDLGDIKRVLAPAFTPMSRTVTDPERNTATSSGGMDWSKFPDHDPDYLQGRISLEQAKARHARPDEGCQCPTCVHTRKLATAQRYVSPEPAPEARCAICHGTGHQGRPEAMGWRSCPSCEAETFWALSRAAYQGNQYSTPTGPLEAARAKVLACGECHGAGRIWEGIPATPCPACRGTGKDNHLSMPPGVLWPRAGGGAGEVVKASVPGQQEQSTHWTTRPDEGMPEPVSAITPSAAADMPGFAAARTHAAMITRPRN
jgi:hypothetical protein